MAGLRIASSALLLVIFFGYWLIGCDSQSQSVPTSERAAAVNVSSDVGRFGRAAISGRAFFRGKAPAPKLIRMTQDPACCPEGAAPVYSEEVTVNIDSTLKNVFVYIKDGLAQHRYPTPDAFVILDQRQCRYEPRVFGIQVGQTLKILNSDRTLHNVHASTKDNTSFNLAMSATMKVRVRTFEHAETMIPIRCNVHPWMIAYAGVLTHPFFDVTGVQGSYHLSALPAGKYVIEAWHETLGTRAQTITLKEAETQSVDFIF